MKCTLLVPRARTLPATDAKFSGVAGLSSCIPVRDRLHARPLYVSHPVSSPRRARRGTRAPTQTATSCLTSCTRCALRTTRATCTCVPRAVRHSSSSYSRRPWTRSSRPWPARSCPWPCGPRLRQRQRAAATAAGMGLMVRVQGPPAGGAAFWGGSGSRRFRSAPGARPAVRACA